MAVWTPERVEILRRYWADGYSCSQIASRLGGITRNSVIGKVTRLGLPGRSTITRKTVHRKAITQRRKRASSVLWHPARPSIPAHRDGMPIPTPAETDIPRVATVDLERHHCRWPCVDDVRGLPSDALIFCGSEPLPGLPYCRPHAVRAYQPPQPRQRETDAVRRLVEKELQVA